MAKKQTLLPLYLGLIGIAGIALVLWLTTPYGVGVSTDSTSYLGGATSLLSGRGYSFNGSPISHYPPLYSLILAGINLLSNNLLHTARYLAALLFGVNLGLAAGLVYLTTGRNLLSTTFAVLFIASSESILELHVWAWSEPLFMALSLTGILLLCLYIVRPSLSWLIASALCLGLAIVTRYIGGAFLPAAFAIVFWGAKDQKIARRISNSLIWLGFACVPPVIVAVRNLNLAGTAADRNFVVHPLAVFPYITRLMTYMVAFIVPISLPNWVQLAIFGLLAAALIFLTVLLFKRNPVNLNWRSPGVLVTMTCLLFFVFYFLALWITISYLDASTKVDWRLVAPAFALLSVAAFPALWAISQRLKSPLLWYGFLILVAISIGMKTADTIQTMTPYRETGLGYTSAVWRHSQTIAFIKSLEADRTIYTNGADVIGFLTEVQAHYFPEKYNPFTNGINSLFPKEIEAMCTAVIQKRALLVFIHGTPLRGNLPTQKEITASCQLSVLQSFADGKVYGLK
ncbi:MAG TPA: hypothetical protein VKF38_12350 [Anaerolineaceae bacterium]|nr:hypothetical protein [Anaerolineaceae bacterium]